MLEEAFLLFTQKQGGGGFRNLDSESTFWSVTIYSQLSVVFVSRFVPNLRLPSSLNLLVLGLVMSNKASMCGPNESLTNLCFMRRGEIPCRKMSKKKVPIGCPVEVSKPCFPSAKWHGPISIRCTSLGIKHQTFPTKHSLTNPVQIWVLFFFESLQTITSRQHIFICLKNLFLPELYFHNISLKYWRMDVHR